MAWLFWLLAPVAGAWSVAAFARRRRGAVLMLAGSAVFLALATVRVKGTVTVVYPEILGCEAGCEVVSAGFPLPWAVDYPGMTMPGVVDLFEIALAGDHFRPMAFAVDVVAFAAVLLVAAVLLRHLLSRQTSERS